LKLAARAWNDIYSGHLHHKWGVWEDSSSDSYKWHPHWKRVEAEDLEMGIGPWASRRRKQI
jgi:hypothetical protein